MIVWQLDIKLHVQPVPITSKVAISSPVHGTLCSIQHYVITFCPVSSNNKTDLHNITDILLNVLLDAISQTTNNFIVVRK